MVTFSIYSHGISTCVLETNINMKEKEMLALHMLNRLHAI